MKRFGRSELRELVVGEVPSSGWVNGRGAVSATMPDAMREGIAPTGYAWDTTPGWWYRYQCTDNWDAVDVMTRVSLLRLHEHAVRAARRSRVGIVVSQVARVVYSVMAVITFILPPHWMGFLWLGLTVVWTFTIHSDRTTVRRYEHIANDTIKMHEIEDYFR